MKTVYDHTNTVNGNRAPKERELVFGDLVRCSVKRKAKSILMALSNVNHLTNCRISRIDGMEWHRNKECKLKWDYGTKPQRGNNRRFLPNSNIIRESIECWYFQIKGIEASDNRSGR